jgi:hypothetical protein
VWITDQFFAADDDIPTTCGVMFATDGEMWEINSATSNLQIQSQWWTREPVTGIGSSYEVRALSTGKVGAWDTSPGADDTWFTISSDREWNVTQSIVGDNNAAATFEVGEDGVESALDSAVIDCTASVF